MNDLARLAGKKTRTVVGLMSGTSHDGVDAVAARITGAGAGSSVTLAAHSRIPYPKALRERIGRAFTGPSELVCRLNFELGEFFARAALAVAAKAGIGPGGIDLVGSHGQTIRHVPRSGARAGSTLQIGEGAVIARRTGAATVSDFRTADVAAGGQGAPLVPYADWILFRRRGKTVMLHNIGGISNVTVVTEAIEGVRGFDTGPGCSLMDEAARLLSGGRMSCDRDGRLARRGKVMPGLLRELMSHPYFRKPPPKSTGRETFGREMAERVVAGHGDAGKEDLLCTLTHLTAGSILDAYSEHIFPYHRFDRIVFGGGGTRNTFLMELLRDLFPGIAVSLTDELGVPAEAREALCFAVLANETLAGNPGNVPAVTGAGSRAVLGKISPACP